MFDTQFGVYCDGGCLQNGTQEAHGYASYLLQSRTGKRQLVRLTDLPGREWGGSVSPDGDQFVYSGDAAAKGTLKSS